jgi:hypothetical protein
MVEITKGTKSNLVETIIHAKPGYGLYLAFIYHGVKFDFEEAVKKDKGQPDRYSGIHLLHELFKAGKCRIDYFYDESKNRNIIAAYMPEEIYTNIVWHGGILEGLCL